jgi:carboxypeptidase D
MQFKLATLTAVLALSSSALGYSRNALSIFNREHPKRNDMVGKPVVPERAHLEKRQSRFLNNNTQQFVVNGTGIPDVDFDIGESYAGLLPISQAANETRKLFFWFFPTTNPDAGEEVVIWFNGGPGCSSLSGLLTENGP